LHRNCLLKHVIERKIGGGIELKGRRRCKKLLDDLKETILETERGSTRSLYVKNSL
jgi:hypothetical protein